MVRADARVPAVLLLAANAFSRMFAWFFVLKQSAMPKVPLSVRLLTPDAAGRPAPASSAWSTGMFLAPPGPQPVTPGAVNVVSLATADVC
jgi:hypothetical protein